MTHLRAIAATLIVVAVAGCSQGASSIPFSAPLLPTAKATVAPAGATPTPSPTATPAPIGTPTVTPLPTATPIATPAPTATPVVTPAPTATPIVTPAPTAPPAFGPVAGMPNALDFTALGAAAALSLAAAQTGYPAPITEADTCGGIVTVTSAPPNGTSTLFVVTPVAAGSCTITLSGGSNQTLDVPVTVTASGLIVSSRRKRT